MDVYLNMSMERLGEVIAYSILTGIKACKHTFSLYDICESKQEEDKRKVQKYITELTTDVLLTLINSKTEEGEKI